jgi:hypothetical protein
MKLRIENLRKIVNQEGSEQNGNAWLCAINGTNSVIVGFDDKEELLKAANAGKLEMTGQLSASGKSFVWRELVAEASAEELTFLKNAYIKAQEKRNQLNLVELTAAWGVGANHSNVSGEDAAVNSSVEPVLA